MEWIIVTLLIIVVLLLLAVLFSRPKGLSQDLPLKDLQLVLLKDSAEQQRQLGQSVSRSMQELREENDRKFSMLQNNLNTKLDQALNERLDANFDRMVKNSEEQAKQLHEMEKALLEQNRDAQEAIIKELAQSIQTMMRVNDEKLNVIHSNINDKLDKSLNERLDSSFGKIGTQLNSLYKTVGELQMLTSGVENLNRTLSNVKTRGTWGEMQLEQILSNIFPQTLYDKNVQTRKNSTERVEFALKIPDKTDGNRSIYLPIDSKFPADLYQKIQEAAAAADRRRTEAAVRELEGRIKSEAHDISSKYINPPDTTDFAIMFLPAEGLYSEVIRIPGLAEYCQQKYKVVVSGPTTISALLNSLAIGFKFLTVSRNTKEVLKVLQNIKAQYDKFGELINKTQRSLDQAAKSTEDMKKRSDLIRSRLDKFSGLELSQRQESELALEDSAREAEYL